MPIDDTVVGFRNVYTGGQTRFRAASPIDLMYCGIYHLLGIYLLALHFGPSCCQPSPPFACRYLYVQVHRRTHVSIQQQAHIGAAPAAGCWADGHTCKTNLECCSERCVGEKCFPGTTLTFYNAMPSESDLDSLLSLPEKKNTCLMCLLAVVSVREYTSPCVMRLKCPACFSVVLRHSNFCHVQSLVARQPTCTDECMYQSSSKHTLELLLLQDARRMA
jgi:hypothetical protein